MIAYISGNIIQKNQNSIVVMTSGGVGYEVRVLGGTREPGNEGTEIELHIYMKVSETSMDLYGFETLEEKKFFELLISVKGVGSKGALNILGLGSIDDIQNAISRGDVKYLTQVSGLGKRTAERLCVELKNKVERGIRNEVRVGDGDSLGEVVDGLVAMGYSKEEARDVVRSLDSEGKSTEELLKQALKYLSLN